jgi:hypothetical protein
VELELAPVRIGELAERFLVALASAAQQLRDHSRILASPAPFAGITSNDAKPARNGSRDLFLHRLASEVSENQYRLEEMADERSAHKFKVDETRYDALEPSEGGSTVHPALTQALAAAHTEELQRAAVRRRTIHLASPVVREPRRSATRIAGQRSVSAARRESPSAETRDTLPKQVKDRQRPLAPLLAKATTLLSLRER